MPRIKYPYEFDPKKRRISSVYRRGRLAIYIIGMLFSLVALLFILSSGLNPIIKSMAVQFPVPILAYGFLIMLTLTIFNFPLSFYSSYIYEHKFKLSRYTIPAWLKDYLKGNLISYVISLIAIYFLYIIIASFSPWWLYAGIMSIIYSAFIGYLYPVLIVPFLWKTESYRDKKMKSKILNLCRRLGVNEIKNVVVIKESEKSTKPNAVFMGFGNSKKIGLFDNLLNSFTKGEVEAVVGHELGHYVNRDILRMLILESILIFPLLFVVDYLVKAFGPIFGIPAISDITSLPLIILTYGILGFILMPMTNTYSRHMETKADEFALQHVRKAVAQVSTEKRLADMHLADLKPHPFIEFWLFSHPSTMKRIEMAQRWRNKLKKRN
ncbi:MAG: M48 family metallopeptidase [Candidatus Aenigmarchaeota archaeon]|nr:M48 family metallopeptidase [Candidatus Aenigmarchaeota archaeon]